MAAVVLYLAAIFIPKATLYLLADKGSDTSLEWSILYAVGIVLITHAKILGLIMTVILTLIMARLMV